SRADVLARLDEYTVWSSQDKHARAYDVLVSDRGRHIGKLLNIDTTEYKQCLACHACDVPSDYRGKIKRGELSYEYSIKDGVSCDVCHGPSLGWIDRHSGVDRREW